MTSLTPAECRVRDDMPQSLSPCPSHTYKTPVLGFGLFRIDRTWTYVEPVQLRQTLKREPQAYRLVE